MKSIKLGISITDGIPDAADMTLSNFIVTAAMNNNAVTPEILVEMQDIVNFEKEQMANKACRYIILGDEKELDMKALEKIGPVKRLTTEEIFGY